MQWRVGSLLLLLLAAAGSTAASDATDQPQQQQSSDVVLLTTDTFADLIEQQPGPALVMFMIPDCMACHALTPDLLKVAANLKGIASVGMVDCASIPSMKTCRAFGVQEFPTLLVFNAGTKINPYTGGAMKEHEKYTGPFGARALAAAITDKLDDSQISHVSSSNEHMTLLQQQPKLAKVLLFTDKSASTVLYKGLSWSYAGRLVFGEVRSSAESAAVLEQYGVTQMPTLLVVKTDGSHEVYDVPLKALPLRAFLDGHALKEPLPAAAAAARGPLGGAAGGAEGLLGEVALRPLEASNLTEIDGRHEMWLLAFYKTTEGASCSAELQQLQTLVQEVQGIVQYGSINTATAGLEARQLQQYGISADALAALDCKLQLVLLPHGIGKAAKGDYAKWSGALNDAKTLQDWILEQIPDFTTYLSGGVEADAFISATADSLPPDAIDSADDRRAPVGKVFLFTTKSSVPGMYKALAAQHFGKSRLLFGWTTIADQDGPAKALMKKMNVRKPPTMSVLLPMPAMPLGDQDSMEEPPQRPSQPDEGKLAIQQYFGPLKFQKMAAWVQAMATLTGLAYNRQHAKATRTSDAEDLDISSQAQLQAACYNKPTLCLMTLLDGDSGSSANKSRDTIRKVATALAGQPLTWVVVDVSQQPSFRRAYGFEVEQLPALVALSTKRMRFAQGAAPFGEASAKQLVTKVLAGSAVTLPLPALPQLVDGGEPDEEPGAGLSEQEEEFDLSEVMAEEVATLLSKEEMLQQADMEIEEARMAKEKAKTTTKKKSKKKKKKKSSKKSKQKSTPAPAKDEL